MLNANTSVIKKKVGILLDPDKATGSMLSRIIDIAVKYKADYILVGGSITFNSIDSLITSIKKRCGIPVVLFPGNLLQLNRDADYIFFLSLISGRNPELLIGNHVIAAPYLKTVREKVIPVGYMLINNGTKTSVEYISGTEAIPANKPDIAAATAMAGEMLGLKTIYLEAGSGADNPVPTEIIKNVVANISIPVIVGGGIRKPNQISDIYRAGATMIVLGNSCEQNPMLLAEACAIRDNFI